MSFVLVYVRVPSSLSDVFNDTLWYPDHLWSSIPLAPRVSLQDLFPSIIIALALTLIKYILATPLIHSIGTHVLPLPPPQTHPIPTWIVRIISTYIRTYRAKHSNRQDMDKPLTELNTWPHIQQEILCELVKQQHIQDLSHPHPVPLSADQVNTYVSAIECNSLRSHSLSKLSECVWQLLLFSLSTLYGLYTLHDKPYITNSIHDMWTNWPLNPVTAELYNYYIYSTSVYVHLLITLLMDRMVLRHRGSFWQMLLHHWITLSLLLFSYRFHCMDLGAIVLVCHDSVDVVLQLAKLSFYAQWRRVSTGLFIMYAVGFFITRIVILITRVIYTGLYTLTLAPVHGYTTWVFMPLLVMLAALQLYWWRDVCLFVYTVVLAPYKQTFTKKSKTN